MNPWPFVALLVALLVGGNAILGKLWLGARDGRATAEHSLEQVTEQARQCSVGVLKLEEAARDRAREGLRAMANARATSLERQTRAQSILSSPSAVPGDSCSSADAALNDWLATKGKP
jgi:hypothetical protein